MQFLCYIVLLFSVHLQWDLKWPTIAITKYVKISGKLKVYFWKIITNLTVIRKSKNSKFLYFPDGPFSA